MTRMSKSTHPIMQQRASREKQKWHEGFNTETNLENAPIPTMRQQLQGLSGYAVIQSVLNPSDHSAGVIGWPVQLLLSGLALNRSMPYMFRTFQFRENRQSELLTEMLQKTLSGFGKWESWWSW